MRDYNAIPFRTPRKADATKVTDHPLVTPRTAEEEKKVDSSRDTASSSTYDSSPTVLTAADALAIRRDGAEATIGRLRNALDEATTRDATSKAALAKSDAVILELRSSVRQLKRQLEKISEEKRTAEEEHHAAVQELRALQSGDHRSAQLQRLEQRAAENVEAKDARVGELQVQLDRAHAQILTADMVRKELEDTLEAEQYTWELRTQDQERTIEQLQQECAALADDLDQCRHQWKEAEENWTKEVQDLQSKLEKAQQEAQHWRSMQGGSQDMDELKERLLQVEQERTELQGCLDEALKELEAVDAELQGDNLRQENERLQKLLEEGDKDQTEALKHLYRWLMERDGADEGEHSSPREAREVLAAIRSHLENQPAHDMDLIETRKQVAELESQISVYRGDLQAREESSSELRESLKEAVALLKPLQDAVAKAEREKNKLEQELDKIRKDKGHDAVSQMEIKRLKGDLAVKDEEIDRLRQEIETLEVELTKAKVAAATSLVQKHSDSFEETAPSSFSKAREELRNKRATEDSLKQMLHNAQSRFASIKSQNEMVEARNNELKGRLREAEERLDSDAIEIVEKQLTIRDAKIHDLENELKVLKGEMAKKDVELREASNALQDLQKSPARLKELANANESLARVRELEAKVSVIREELKSKKESEKTLKKSLKEALGLLKPLQRHLEEAEGEKRQLKDELRELRQRFGEDVSVYSRSMGHDTSSLRDLEETVRHLEKENAQLHDALEDMSQSVNASHLSGVTNMSQKDAARLREEIVELKSRNEVTSLRLEDASIENHSLVEALKKREQEDRAFMDEIKALREQLKRSQSEVENAKYIATQALVKVEELTMAGIEQVSLHSGDYDREEVFQQMSHEVDLKMRAVREQRPNVQYRYKV